MAKVPNHRRVKLNRSYYVEEAATCLGVHKNTVRRWIAKGLPIVGGRGRTLILGCEIRTFLEARRTNAKRPCPPGHLFCLKCRAARRPAEGMVEYQAITASSGNIKALCPNCLSLMHRRIKRADLAGYRAELLVTAAHPSMDLSQWSYPSLSSDSI